MEPYKFNGFSYYSDLDSETEQNLPDALRLEGVPSAESILFRLLLGTIKFKFDQFEELYEQKVCYTKIRDEFTNRVS